MRCPACKTRNLRNSQFCAKCAQPLAPDAAPALTPAPFEDKPEARPDAALGMAAAVEPVSAPLFAPTTPLFEPGEPLFEPTEPVFEPTTPPTASVAPPPVEPPAAPLPVEAANLAPPPRPAMLAASTGPAYRPSGACPPQALGRMLLATVLGAVVVGTVYHFIARYLDFLFFFQAAVGFALGFGLAWAIKTGKCRNPALAVSCAIVAAVLTYGTMLFLDSRAARPAMAQALTADIVTQLAQRSPHKAQLLDNEGNPTPAALAQLGPQAQPLVEQALTPWKTLRIYLAASAAAGVNLKHNGVGKGIPIAGNGYWFLLLVKVGIVAVVASLITYDAAADSFCDHCERWLLDLPMTRVHPAQSELLMQKATAQDWLGLMAVPVGPTMDDKTYTEVKLAYCSSCTGGLLSIKTRTDNKFQTLLDTRLAPPEGERFIVASVAQGQADEPEDEFEADAAETDTISPVSR